MNKQKLEQMKKARKFLRVMPCANKNTALRLFMAEEKKAIFHLKIEK